MAAVDYFQQALARSPEDATIKAACAMAASRIWFFGGPGSEASGQLARRLAQEAIQRAPNLAEAHMALAIVRFHEGDSESSVREARLALASAPASADAHALIGRVLLELGPIAEAIRRSETALSLESDTAIVCSDLARAHALLGDWDASDAYLGRARRLGDAGATWFVLMRLLMWRGDRAGVEAALSTALAATEETSRTIGGAMRAVLHGKVLPSQLVASGHFATEGGGVRRSSFYPQMGAELAAFIGNHEEVVRMVQLAAEGGLLDVVWLDSVRCSWRCGPTRASPRCAPRWRRARGASARRTASSAAGRPALSRRVRRRSTSAAASRPTMLTMVCDRDRRGRIPHAPAAAGAHAVAAERIRGHRLGRGDLVAGALSISAASASWQPRR